MANYHAVMRKEVARNLRRKSEEYEDKAKNLAELASEIEDGFISDEALPAIRDFVKEPV